MSERQSAKQLSLLPEAATTQLLSLHVTTVIPWPVARWVLRSWCGYAGVATLHAPFKRSTAASPRTSDEAPRSLPKLLSRPRLSRSLFHGTSLT